MKKQDVRAILDNEPMRLKEAARKLGAERSTLWRYITEGRKRASDGKVIYLTAIKGPDGGYRTNQEAYVRFFEELNGGAK